MIVAHIADRVDADQRPDDADDENHHHRESIEPEQAAEIRLGQAAGQIHETHQGKLGQAEQRGQEAAAPDANDDDECRHDRFSDEQ